MSHCITLSCQGFTAEQRTELQTDTEFKPFKIKLFVSTASVKDEKKP